MRAALVRHPEQIPVYAEFAEPQPAAGECVVTVSAAALSHVTRSRASGAHYSSAGRFPFVPGIDGVGRLKDGRRVYFVLPSAPNGAMAERTIVPESHCIPLQDALDDVTAAAIANPGMSSWAALAERARLQPGETVLINGATGVSGRLAVQIARHFGAGKVIATGRNTEALNALGADMTIALDGSEERPFLDQFAQGVDVVLDYLWGRSAEQLLIAGATAGADALPIRFIQIGSVSGQDITLPSAVLRSSAIQLMGSGLGSIPLDRMLAALDAVLKATVPAGLTIATRPVPLSEVERAWGEDDKNARLVFTVDRSDWE